MPRLHTPVVTHADLPDGGREVAVTSQGTTTRYVIPGVLPAGEDCMVCATALDRGVPVALPFCPGCNSQHSVLLHAPCARQLRNMGVPRGQRPQVKHLICPKKHAPAAVEHSYWLCEQIARDLDRAGVPAGRCGDCLAKLSTRQGHLVHKNPAHPQVDASLLSDEEAALLAHDRHLFVCPKTFTACSHCGHMDESLRTRAHERICGRLDRDDRAWMKKQLVDIRNEEHAISKERGEDLEWFAYSRDYVRAEAEAEEEEVDTSSFGPSASAAETARDLQVERDGLIALSLAYENDG